MLMFIQQQITYLITKKIRYKNGTFFFPTTQFKHNSPQNSIQDVNGSVALISGIRNQNKKKKEMYWHHHRLFAKMGGDRATSVSFFELLPFYENCTISESSCLCHCSRISMVLIPRGTWNICSVQNSLWCKIRQLEYENEKNATLFIWRNYFQP